MPEERTCTIPTGFVVTAPLEHIISMLITSSGVMFLSLMHVNVEIGAADGIHQVQFVLKSAQPFVADTMTSNTVVPVSPASCALQSKPSSVPRRTYLLSTQLWPRGCVWRLIYRPTALIEFRTAWHLLRCCGSHFLHNVINLSMLFFSHVMFCQSHCLTAAHLGAPQRLG